MVKIFSRLLIGLVLTFGLAACSGSSTNDRGEQASRKPVALSVRFPIPLVENGQAPFYLAQDHGYYRAAGLDVTFNMGSPELSPVKMVASKQDQIGVLGGPDTMLVARSQDVPLTAVAVLHRNSDFPVVLVKADSPIRDVKDLEGKRVGMFYGHISTDVLRSFFKRADVKVQEVDTGFDYNPLITGRVDAEWAFSVTAGIDLPAAGQPVRMISPQEVGIRTHGYTLFVRQDYLDANRDVVARFVGATLMGVRDAVTDPNAAVEALVRRNPKLNRAITLKRQQAYNAVTTRGAPYYYGYVDDDMIKSTYDRLRDLGVLKAEFDYRAAFDPSIAKNNQPE
jgi:NitT/TauT family transport system substrate-binding protein